MKKLFLLLAVSAILLPARAAFPAPTEIDRVVAVVGTNVVTLSELQSEMAPALNELNQKYAGDELARASDRLKRVGQPLMHSNHALYSLIVCSSDGPATAM